MSIYLTPSTLSHVLVQHMETLGKYKLDEIIGSGGMGVVYKGHDTRISRTVAIKTIHPHLLEGEIGRQLRSRFRREASVVGKLNHSNIITLYDYDDTGELPYFVMEYIHGEEIKTLLDKGKIFTAAETIKIATEALSALSLAHKNGIIHRDIKPANLMLLEDHTVKIADFGIARIQETVTSEADGTVLEGCDKTQVGTVLGSPRYMSPEQFFAGEVDQRSDLYSIAIVMYEMISGRRAFTKNMGARIKAPYPAPPEIKDKLVNRLYQQIIVKALAIDPAERYQSADEMIADLDNLIHLNSKPAKKQSNKLVLSAAATITAIAIIGGLIFYKPHTTETIETGNTNNVSTGSEETTAAVPIETIESVEAFKPVETFEPAEKKPSVNEVAIIDREPATNTSSIPDLDLTQLEEKALTQHLSGNLITPEGDNAFQTYKDILEIQPDNATALEGIDKIENNIITTAESLIQSQNTKAAIVLLKKSKILYPASEKIENLLKSTKTITNTITLSTNKELYSVGDKITLSVTSSTPSFIRCYYQTASAEVYQIFPNPFQQDNNLNANETIEIPNSIADANFSIEPFQGESFENFICLSNPTAFKASYSPELLSIGLEQLTIKEFEEIENTFKLENKNYSVKKIKIFIKDQ